MTNTANKLSAKELKMECSSSLQFLAISKYSPIATPEAIEDWLTLLQRDSHANRSVRLDINVAHETSEICGPLPLASLKQSSQSGACWRTSQDCLVGMDTSEQSLKTWPRRGSMRNGTAFQRKALEPRIKEIGYGYLPLNPLEPHTDPLVAQAQEVVAGQRLIPTPRASDPKGCRDPKAAAGAFIRIGAGSLQETIAVIHPGGRLNPPWVEWLMGWPLGATDLKPLETDKYQEWLRKHGKH